MIMNNEKKVVLLIAAGLLLAAFVPVSLFWLSGPLGRQATVALVPASCPVLKQIGVALEPAPVGCIARGRFVPDLIGNGGKLIQGGKKAVLSESQIAAMTWN